MKDIVIGDARSAKKAAGGFHKRLARLDQSAFEAATMAALGVIGFFVLAALAFTKAMGTGSVISLLAGDALVIIVSSAVYLRANGRRESIVASAKTAFVGTPWKTPSGLLGRVADYDPRKRTAKLKFGDADTARYRLSRLTYAASVTLAKEAA